MNFNQWISFLPDLNGFGIVNSEIEYSIRVSYVGLQNCLLLYRHNLRTRGQFTNMIKPGEGALNILLP